jgi:hypothetical protein
LLLLFFKGSYVIASPQCESQTLKSVLKRGIELEGMPELTEWWKKRGAVVEEIYRNLISGLCKV